jgi:purine-binding chemotaxis protein CheW
MENKSKISEIIQTIETGKSAKKDKSKIIKDFLIIDINSNYLGIQVEYLREIFDLQDKNDIVPIPFTPPYIMGIINVRGEIIPVISLLKILDMEEKFIDFNKIGIIDDKFKLAFPFTNIIDMKTVEIKNIKQIQNASQSNKDQFLNQEFEYEDRIITIIDLLKIYSSGYIA